MSLIRTYSDPSHRQSVIALWRLAFGEQTGHRAPELSIDNKLSVADGLFFVALQGDQVVGTVMAGYDGHRGWLYSVAVHPEHRKQGIGADLVRHAEHSLLAKGCPKINLQVVSANAAVTAFYESLGYSVEPHISMGKRLDATLGNR